MLKPALAVVAAICVAACVPPPAQGPLPERLPAPGAATTAGAASPAATPASATTTTTTTTRAPSGSVARALSAPDRPSDQVAQDGARQSAAVLAFSGIKSGDRVLDLGAYTGYSSWLLSGLVGSEGEVVAQNPQEWFAQSEDIGKAMTRLRAARANVAHQVMPFDQLEGDPGSFDAVFSGLIYHDTAYMDVDRILMNREVYDLLKPGGVYIVVDHHARQGSATDDAEELHRIDADLVRREVENVGFRLEAESRALTRSGDNLTRNVFDGAIRGKTSQFVYKFVKPGA